MRSFHMSAYAMRVWHGCIVRPFPSAHSLTAVLLLFWAGMNSEWAMTHIQTHVHAHPRTKQKTYRQGRVHIAHTQARGREWMFTAQMQRFTSQLFEGHVFSHKKASSYLTTVPYQLLLPPNPSSTILCGSYASTSFCRTYLKTLCSCQVVFSDIFTVIKLLCSFPRLDWVCFSYFPHTDDTL